MAQTIVRNLQGMAISFNTSQIVNIRATNDGQLLQVFRSILPGAINEMKPLALVQTKLSSEHRQISILKAFMISPTYWDSVIAAATPETVKQLNIYALTSDFLLGGDRFNRVLSRLSPKQERKSKTYEIASVTEGGSTFGQVDLGLPFTSDSLVVVGAVQTSIDADLGLIMFSEADVGKLVEVDFVTAPVFNVIRVTRTHDQVEDHNGEHHPAYAYVMHPSLADPLGIELPVV